MKTRPRNLAVVLGLLMLGGGGGVSFIMPAKSLIKSVCSVDHVSA